MCIFASALYIKLGKQLILLYFKTMQNSDHLCSGPCARERIHLNDWLDFI